MSRIVTDVEGALAHPEPRSHVGGRSWPAWRPLFLFGAICAVSVGPALAISAPTGAATIGSLQAQANQLQQEISSTQAQIGALGQRYDQAESQLAAINDQITVTKGKIATDQQRVSTDRLNLRTAAIVEYVNSGTTSNANPLFSGSQQKAALQQEYGQVATGNLDVAVADLHTAEVALDAEKANLLTEKSSAQNAVNAAYAAQQQANAQEARLTSDLGQVKGQLGALEQQAQAAATAAQATTTRSVLTAGASFPPPPPDSRGGVAVAAAETQLGVPYVWGGETPGVGFDCSGLVAWAWGQAGVPLPHYSGAQYADSTPVPVSALEPGDLLFYGPGGSQHVAMYVGGGEMIEAPYTGQVVHITPIRLGDGFAGAGRP
jgi:cell wall-associated NlpC family hydrolase